MTDKPQTQPLTPEQFRALRLAPRSLDICVDGQTKTITVLEVLPPEPDHSSLALIGSSGPANLDNLPGCHCLTPLAAAADSTSALASALRR